MYCRATRLVVAQREAESLYRSTKRLDYILARIAERSVEVEDYQFWFHTAKIQKSIDFAPLVRVEVGFEEKQS